MPELTSDPRVLDLVGFAMFCGDGETGAPQLRDLTHEWRKDTSDCRTDWTNAAKALLEDLNRAGIAVKVYSSKQMVRASKDLRTVPEQLAYDFADLPPDVPDASE